MTDQLTRAREPEAPPAADQPKRQPRWSKRLIIGAALLVLGVSTGAAFAFGALIERADHAQTRDQLRDAYSENSQLWQQYSTCRAAGETAVDLNDAWHVWKDDKTNETAEAVNQHQDALWELVARCEGGDNV